jgi:PAS domain-containing protein
VAQHPIEVILMRQLASYLATPIFLLDHAGTMVYFNLPAEAILGLRFDETGEMTLDEWGTAFKPTSRDGTPVAADELPLLEVVDHRRPAQGSFWIRGLDGVSRHIAVAAFPLIGQSGRDVGSVAVCWEDQSG